jgi:hypothetical protein
MIFWLVLKLEISYNRVLISWRILVSFRGFFWRECFLHGEIICVPMILLLPYDSFKFKWQGHKCDTPLVLTICESLWFHHLHLKLSYIEDRSYIRVELKRLSYMFVSSSKQGCLRTYPSWANNKGRFNICT